jgi:hypothetical protein
VLQALAVDRAGRVHFGVQNHALHKDVRSHPPMGLASGQTNFIDF